MAKIFQSKYAAQEIEQLLDKTSENSDLLDNLPEALDKKVPNTRTVNGKLLSEDVVLSSSDVGADEKGTASTAVSTHNTATDSHNDIRLLITELTTRLNALADSDDATLDQMSEIVAYIKNNKTLIESVTTNKVNVSDIINNLTSNVSNKPLSAAQGVALKELIDTLQTSFNSHTEDTTNHITSAERTNWNDANSKKHSHSNASVLNNTTASFTVEDKNKLNNVPTFTLNGTTLTITTQ